MTTLVTIKCKGCGWAQVVEPQKEMECGSLRMGTVLLDGHRVMCPLCPSTLFEVVGVDVKQ